LCRHYYFEVIKFNLKEGDLMKQVLQNMDWAKLGRNLVIFTAPAVAVFFGQLAMKVDVRVAGLTASLVLYNIIADFFRKFNESKENLQ